MVRRVTPTGQAPRARASCHGPLPRPRRWLDLLGVLVVAGCLYLSFPDHGSWPMAILAMAFFVALLDRVGAGRAAWLSFLVGMAFWLAHIDWVPVAVGGRLPWVALAATQAVAFAVWGWIVALARVWHWARTWWGQTVVTSLTWVGIEQLRSSWPWTGFPWAKLAYSQVDGPLGHLAPWGGEVVVSFVVVALGVLLRRVFSLHPAHDVAHGWTRPALLATAAVVLVAPLALTLPTAQEDGSLDVGVVQGNVQVPGAQTFSVVGKVAGNNAREMAKLLATGVHLDLVVWGEGSLDHDPDAYPAVASIVRTVVDEGGVPTVVGFNRYMKDTDSIHNYIGVWYPGTGLGEKLYGKQEPVPFGEFIPWRPFVSALATEAAQIRVDMSAVDNVSLLPVTLADGRTVQMATGICFEVAAESLLGEGVAAGGELIVVPSNNYHFRTSAESTQQAQMLRFRAMEYARSAIQASTNGVSVIVRPDGSVVARSGKQEAASLTADVPLRTSLTPTARLGSCPAYAAMVGTAVVVLASVVSCLATRRRSRT